MSAQDRSRNNNGEIKCVSRDGIDRRDFLNCMEWAGTGLLWSFIGGVPVSRLLADGSVTVETFSNKKVISNEKR